MKLFLITDIHYGEDVNYAKYGPDVNNFGSHFEQYVPALQKLIPSHDLVVNLGDLIHETETEQDAEQYKKALSFLQVGKLVKSVSGNHDMNTFTRPKFAELIGEKHTYYSFDLGGYHHIVLDGVRDKRSDPHYLDDPQLKWFEEDLSKTKLKTIVYCHFPLDEQNVESNYYFKTQREKAFIQNRAMAREIIEASGKVLLVFSGHLHFFSEMEINGIKYITVPSFTENDGTQKPKAEVLSVELKNSNVSLQLLKI